MKTLELIEVDIQNEDGSNITYGDLIKICLDTAPEGGFSRKDNKDRDRIEDAIKDDKLELEDSDYINLKDIVMSKKWHIRDKHITKFQDAVEDMGKD